MERAHSQGGIVGMSPVPQVAFGSFWIPFPWGIPPFHFPVIQFSWNHFPKDGDSLKYPKIGSWFLCDDPSWWLDDPWWPFLAFCSFSVEDPWNNLQDFSVAFPTNIERKCWALKKWKVVGICIPSIFLGGVGAIGGKFMLGIPDFSFHPKGSGILLLEDDSVYEGNFTEDLAFVGKVGISSLSSGNFQWIHLPSSFLPAPLPGAS